MIYRFLVLPLLVGITGCSSPSQADRNVRDVTIPYLNAAITSIPDMEPLRLEGIYLGNLHKTPLWEGYSLFNIGEIDGSSELAFTACQTGGEVFEELFHATTGTRYQIDGVKTKLSGRFYDCVLVTRLTKLGAVQDASGATYTVTIEHADGTREVLRNVAAGQPIDLGAATIRVEREK